MAYNIQLPPVTQPIIDPSTGTITDVWYRALVSLFSRTGGSTGIATSSALTTAQNAQALASVAQSTSKQGVTAAAAAQATANAATALADAAQTTASSGLALATTLNGTVVFKSNFQLDGIAPLDKPVFTTEVTLPAFILASLLPQAADDPTAASVGVAVGQFYVSNSIVCQRQS